MTRNLALALTTLALITVPLAPTVGAQSGAKATFEDQASGGQHVVVDSVTVPNGGFVAIHDQTLQDGAVLRSVVGSSAYLNAGTHQDVRVRLDDPISEDQSLVAMPHKDTDGDRIYSFVAESGQADGPYTRDGGAVVDAANVTASATVKSTDHPTNGTWVVVDRVEMVDGGFVAIHDDLLLEGQPVASVVGASDYLKPGMHRNVRVQLDEPISEDQTLISMPHEDTDDDRTYDFTSSAGQDDGPYAGPDGGAVVDDWQANVTDTATVAYDAQSSGGHLVDVRSVFLPNGGFLTVHDSTLLDGEALASVRGTSDYLKPGLHRHVVVELDDPVMSDDTLIGMPHKDTDGDRTYDFVSSEGQDDGPYTNDDGAVVDSAETTISAGVHAHGQESDGRTVTIAYVDLSEPGFVTIHDPKLQAGKVLDSVVGVSDKLQAGAHRDVEVELDSPLRSSQTVLPMPHKDTNGNGAYDFVSSEGQADGPFATGGGDAVLDTARATVRSTVTISDQSGLGTTVTVDSVTLSDGGFVTIHDQTLLDGEVLPSVRGSSDKLEPGTHEDVEVELHAPLKSDATTIAMPHYDTNQNGEYDFVTSNGQEDGPYVAGGGAVVHPASFTFTGGGDEARSRPMPGFAGVAVVVGLAGAALVLRRRG